jgi:hypothetical protein
LQISALAMATDIGEAWSKKEKTEFGHPPGVMA